MREEKIKGVQELDLHLANTVWTVSKWIKWTLRNGVGVIIEDGKVTGWDLREKRFHA